MVHLQKVEVIKPVLLKAGIPLALSVVAFIYARIMAKKSVPSQASALQNQVSSIKTDSAEEVGEEEEGEEMITSTHLINNLVGVSGYNNKVDYGLEILGLRNQVEGLEKKEWEIKRQLVHYHDLKEQESVLMENKYMLLLEKGLVDLLDREISSMEAENKRVENLMVGYLRMLEQLRYWKCESGLLRRKVKKLLKKTKEQSFIIEEKTLKIEVTKEEILRSRDTLEQKCNVIRKLQDEMGELQFVIGQLEEQKSELSSKLQLAEHSGSTISKIEDEGITMEDYKQLVDEYEQVQKELIYLRWTNACLRHELMRNHEQTAQQQEQNQEKKKVMELEFEGCGGLGDYDMERHLVLEQSRPCLNVEIGCKDAGSKRPKLPKKLKIWAEGSEKMKSKYDEKEKHAIKCFERHSHSVCNKPEEEHVNLARKSCSSAWPFVAGAASLSFNKFALIHCNILYDKYD